MGAMRWIRLLGVIELGFVALLTTVSPHRIGPLPMGMRTPVLAFELARDEAEIERMFGPPSATRDDWLAQMRLATVIDYAFLLAYGAFFACAARALLRDAERRRPLHFAFGLACLAPLADMAENSFMLTILDTIDSSYAAALSGLAYATWIKWFALAVCVACLCPTLFRHASFAARAAAVFGALALPVTLAALLMRGIFAEAMFTCNALCTIGIWVWSIREPQRLELS
ncbi:MAG TPA: hypothetical protein VJV78_42735 [Polyangiales bacterium]|nr:hypothetical protein [Polyangiales bacterium]